MKKFLFLLVMMMLMLPVNVFAQEVEDDEEDVEEEFSLKEALAQIKIKEPPFSLEVRPTEPEIILRYKRFSIDYNQISKLYDIDYIKLNFDNPIISMMGMGIDWNCGVAGVLWKDTQKNFAPVPTLGLNFYATVLPKIKFYAQFSGMPVGGFGRVYDSETGLRYTPIKHFTITGGYRHLSTKVHDNDHYMRARTAGPFIGIRSDF